ncbi:MAG: shikimate dehydrogenase [Longimicrobiaceae bacterium]
MISSCTRLAVLLGDPVEQSLSPAIQNAALRAAGLDAVYLALRCDGGALPGLVRGVAEAGGGGNVTVPHKESAAGLMERKTAALEVTGACNTFWSEGGELCGDNTDVAGFLGALERELRIDPAGARVLLLGAGGAARAVLYGLGQRSVSEVVVVNRTPARARRLVTWFDYIPLRTVESLADLRGESFDLAVNATTLGLRPDDPLPFGEEVKFGAGFDLVYRPGGTGWIRAMRERGVPAADGTEMLLRQGAASFERWWGQEASLEAMRAALKERA